MKHIFAIFLFSLLFVSCNGPLTEQKNVPHENIAETCRTGEIEVEGNCVTQVSMDNDVFAFPLSPDIQTGSVQEIGVTGFLAEPSGAEIASILIVPDALGVTDSLQKYSQILATLGYRVIILDVSDDTNQIQQIQKGADYMQGISEQGKLIVMGFGQGGESAYNFSIAHPVAGTLIYYGQISNDPEVIKKLQAPVFGVFALQDTSLDLDDLKQTYDLMLELEKDTFVQFYEAEKGFMEKEQTTYNAQSAMDSWILTESFLKSLVE